MPVSTGLSHRIFIRFSPAVFQCSCAARRRPCVHALALAALYNLAGDADFPPADELPDWAAFSAGEARFAHLRSNNEQAAVARREQRHFDRLERATEGLADLENWLEDLLRRGLATTMSESEKPFSGIATRLADASLPGPARLFRNLQGNAAGANVESVASVLGACYLAIRSFKKRDMLPSPLVFDLQTFLGIAIKKEEVLQNGERMADTWSVLGRVEEPLEERLWQRRTWLQGASGRFALLLDFAFGESDFGPGFSPGTSWQGTLAFYPSNYLQRAIPAEELQACSGTMPPPNTYNNLEALAVAYAGALGRQPWLSWFPAVVDLIPTPDRQAFDSEKKGVPLQISTPINWKLVSVSGGRPLRIFGEWDGHSLRPLAFWETPEIFRNLPP
jgi:hypothetical protein